MSATYSIDPSWKDLPPVMRVAVLTQLRPSTSKIMRTIDEKSLTARAMMAALQIDDKDIPALADFAVSLLQLQAYGLVVKTREGA